MLTLQQINSLGLKPEGNLVDTVTGKPKRFSVTGFPPRFHLSAEVNGTDQSLYRYTLTRIGDQDYGPKHLGFPKPETALEALKCLLKWDPV
jgi:hypothetical protein